MPEVLTKQERIVAYRIVDEILSRPIPAVVLRHQIKDGMDQFNIEIRAAQILENLRQDAKDLWDES
jgi:hypothetical protein